MSVYPFRFQVAATAIFMSSTVLEMAEFMPMILSRGCGEIVGDLILELIPVSRLQDSFKSR